MSQRSNIVSFDAAKRGSASRSRRASGSSRSEGFYSDFAESLDRYDAAAKAQSRRRGSASRRSAFAYLDQAKEPVARSSSRRSPSAGAAVSRPAQPKSSGLSSLSDEEFWAEMRGDEPASSAGSSFSVIRGGASASAVSASAGSDRKVDSSLEDRFGGEEFDNEKANAEVNASKAERKRRKRAKDRAGRMFAEQFGSDDAPSSGEGSPRAAVYEGKMGKNARKAARLVPSGKAVAQGLSSFNPAALLSSFFLSRRGVIAAVVFVCLVGSFISIYGPAQQYYQSIRDNDRTQAQYAAIEARSDALEAQNDRLTSDAGVETIAHKDYGWVKQGEQTAKVEGLSDSAYAKEEAGSTITANVAIGNIDYPETWYSPILDKFFGVGQ